MPRICLVQYSVPWTYCQCWGCDPQMHPFWILAVLARRFDLIFTRA